MKTSTVPEQASTPPPPPPDDVDDGLDDGESGWWSASPTWAKAVVAGGLALLLLLVGGIAGGLLERSAAPTYGPPDGSVDVGFLQDMSTHHRQAVQMALQARERSVDPEVRQLAFDIETTQIMQVGRMEGWLALWNQPTTRADGLHMGWMGMPTSTMPGMATDADLARLRGATGPALDVEFLQLMLRHHEGGVDMLRVAAAQAQVPAVRSLSDAMLRAQTAESDTMRGMLAARGAMPLPSPAMVMGAAPGN